MIKNLIIMILLNYVFYGVDGWHCDGVEKLVISILLTLCSWMVVCIVENEIRLAIKRYNKKRRGVRH